MYERQFVIADKNYIIDYNWSEISIGDSLCLKYHPLLNCTVTNEESRQIILLGYILDPSNPELSNSEITKNILVSCSDITDISIATEKLNGRYLIIYTDKTTFILGDPYGLRSVYYTFDGNNHLFCASQPGHISKALGLKYNQTLQSEFFESDYYKKEREAWIPSGITLYDSIKHLVPNHYLDCAIQKQIRFWPRHRRVSNKPEDVVSKCASLIQNSILAASKRSELALPLTAGYDSRIIMAATKVISDKIFYYTLKYGNLIEDSPDITIPKKILGDLGLKHNVFDCYEEMDKVFKDSWVNNIELAHTYYGDIAFGMKSVIPPDKIALKGVSEVARGFFYKIKKNSGYDLAKLMSMESCPFIVSVFEDWLNKSEKVIEESDYKMLDVFYWEHRLGSWRAMSALEFDVIHDILDPFNCRYLIELFLSVDEKYRIGKYPLLRMIIKELWPEMLNYPINPLFGKDKFINSIRDVSIKLGFFELGQKYFGVIKKYLT